MAVDECELRGLTVNRFSDELVKRLERLKETGKLPKFAAILNPVDVTGSADSAMFEAVTRILLEASEVDGLIVLGLHQTPGLQEDFVDRIANLAKQQVKPVVACDIGETEMALFIRSRFDKLGIPSYGSPEGAARAMAALSWYGGYLKRHEWFESYIELFMNRHGIKTMQEDKLITELRRPL